MPRFDSLNEWLLWLESLHPVAIDLSLDRVYKVARSLGILQSPSHVSHDFSGALASRAKVVSIAGTNGKGSCVASLQQLLMSDESMDGESTDEESMRVTVGSYTSPHLNHYCERVMINGQIVTEAQMCQAFAVVDAARQTTSLTYFEFGTLAALWLFVEADLDYIFLEVGLGGRFDAVNIVDADIAVITSIDLDHQAWLGDNRDSIAREKLGIMREGSPLILAETELTPSLQDALKTNNVYWCGRDYQHMIHHDKWQWSTSAFTLSLPIPQLPEPSVGAALQVLSLLDCLPDQTSISAVISTLTLAGRLEQLVFDNTHIILDVAHNPAATHRLASLLSQLSSQRLIKVRAVTAVMADKDTTQLLQPLLPYVEHWYLGPLDLSRALDVPTLMSLIVDLSGQANVTEYRDLGGAFAAALTATQDDDLLLVFGSFYTVAAIKSLLSALSSSVMDPFCE